MKRSKIPERRLNNKKSWLSSCKKKGNCRFRRFRNCMRRLTYLDHTQIHRHKLKLQKYRISWIERRLRHSTRVQIRCKTQIRAQEKNNSARILNPRILILNNLLRYHRDHWIFHLKLRSLLQCCRRWRRMKWNILQTWSEKWKRFIRNTLTLRLAMRKIHRRRILRISWNSRRKSISQSRKLKISLMLLKMHSEGWKNSDLHA